MALTDAVSWFTEESHILSSMAIVCGTADNQLTAWGGTADLEGTPVTEDTIYDLASLTKLFTGLLTYRLRDEGLLDLSKPITAYAPQFIHLSDLTVDQVLGFEMTLVTPERVDTQHDRAAALNMLHQITARPNGAGRIYSDMHAMVIKEVLEGASGSTYMELLMGRFLQPLGMDHLFCAVPEELRPLCASYDREHRLERGKYILREGIRKGEPHDPKARVLNLNGSDCPGHAGLFGTLNDVSLLARGVLQGNVVSKQSLTDMARNRTGRPLPEGGWTQFLGSLCYVKHPELYHSEVPVYMGDHAIALSGFTGHHISIDPERGIFVCYLGNRVLNRLTFLIEEPGKNRTDYGLSASGQGQFTWPDGSRIWSSVDYVHQKDAHFHAEVKKAMGL